MPRARASRHSGDCELERLAERGRDWRAALREALSPRGQDDSSLGIAVDHEACILCDRCMRGCDDIRHNWCIGRDAAKATSRASPSILNVPMGSSSCVSCGECMVSCPTGALTNKRVVGHRTGRRRRRSMPTELLAAAGLSEGVSGTFLELNQERGREAALSSRARSSAAKASSARPLSTFSKARSRSSSPARWRT